MSDNIRECEQQLAQQRAGGESGDAIRIREALEWRDRAEDALERTLAALKRIAEEPHGSWKATLAWQVYKREVPDAQ